MNLRISFLGLILITVFAVNSRQAFAGLSPEMDSVRQIAEISYISPIKDFQSITADFNYKPDSIINIRTFPKPSMEVVKKRLDSLDMEIDLKMNKRIYSFINYFTVRNRDYSRMILRRTKRYFPIFEKKLKKHNIPEELKYLAVVESGLNTNAESPAGAVGLWQFMKRTGKHLSLNINWKIDERKDPEKATEAACVYLKQLYNMFDDWELAMAAYNCGPGNVRRAVRYSGYKDSFWEVYRYLPRETRSYVPQFVAIVYMMNYHKEHNLNPEYYEWPVAHHSLEIDHYMDLELLARELNVCTDILKKLNPTLETNYIPYNENFKLNIPSDKINFFKQNYCSIIEASSKKGVKSFYNHYNPGPDISKNGKKRIVHDVKRGQYLGSIAARYNVRISHIKQWNRLRGNTIYPGQDLVIYTKHPPKHRNRKVAAKNKNAKSSGVYYVQPGDTLWEISKKYKNTSIQKLKKINSLNSNSLRPGQKLKLFDKS